MSFAQKVLGFGRESETSAAANNAEATAEEADTPTLPSRIGEFFTGDTPPAYSLDREITLKFPEEVTIRADAGDTHAEITVDTPKTTESFEVRIEDYTSRFGELDVEMITVGGYAVNLYHPKENGKYFVRRLYYYEGDGVDGEQHREDVKEPRSPEWVRDAHLGETVTAEMDSHLRVYDWRENMLTHDKPTPSTGEVVLRFRDSPNAGGGRNRITQVLTVDGLQTPVSESIDVSFICLDTESGEYILYAPVTESEWCIIRVPIGRSVSDAEVSWERTTDTRHRPSQKDNLVWVRSPAHTWFVDAAVTS